jgi:hypothetical protein
MVQYSYNTDIVVLKESLKNKIVYSHVVCYPMCSKKFRMLSCVLSNCCWNWLENKITTVAYHNGRRREKNHIGDPVLIKSCRYSQKNSRCCSAGIQQGRCLTLAGLVKGKANICHSHIRISLHLQGTIYQQLLCDTGRPFNYTAPVEKPGEANITNWLASPLVRAINSCSENVS